MGDQWPWEAKELDPQRPSYNSGEFKQTRVRIWHLKDFHNQQKLPGMMGPITQCSSRKPHLSWPKALEYSYSWLVGKPKLYRT